ncbi:MAG: hypothetical protein OEQ81_09045 [Flavobacteriaceae bacterium]|nr:hypothetical protein [Flavobacteriaceae bacterium]
MKRLITLLLLVLSSSLFAQLDQIPGTYFRQLGKGPHVDTYTLTLHEDGTFLFHFYRKSDLSIPQEEHKYGKGKWTIEMKKNFSTNTFIVVFLADSVKDFDGKHTLDFNGSKARFVGKSERAVTDKAVQTRLQFFESGINWMERVAIYKQTDEKKPINKE